MIIETVKGSVEIHANMVYYDISYPFGAIRSFLAISDPVLEDDFICWEAKSEDCYSEVIKCRVQADQPDQTLIFNDYDSANRFLYLEDMRIQFSSIDYLLLALTDILCSEIQVAEKISKMQEHVVTLELDILKLRLRLELYDNFGIDVLDAVSSGYKSVIDNLLSMTTSALPDTCGVLLESINKLKEYRQKVTMLRSEFISRYQ